MIGVDGAAAAGQLKESEIKNPRSGMPVMLYRALLSRRIFANVWPRAPPTRAGCGGVGVSVRD
jgi:hypothetical protein